MDIVVGIIGGVVAGTLVTLIGTKYLWGLQRPRRELGYDILSAHVLIPGPPEATPDIKLTVRNRLIDPASTKPDDFSEVEEVIGFRILLKNTGDHLLDEQVVVIDLGEPVTTLSASIEKQPDLGNASIVMEPQAGEPQLTRIAVPFLNSGEEIILNIQSVGNMDRNCTISAGAPGLRYYDFGKRQAKRAAISMGFALTVVLLGMAAAATLLVLYPSDNDTPPQWAAPSLWAAISVAGVTLISVFFLANTDAFRQLLIRRLIHD